MVRSLPDTVIFDVDGTLYEEIAVYERFATELCRSLPTERSQEFLKEIQLARAGGHAARVGMGYDCRTDTLFRHFSGTIAECYDWNGSVVPCTSEPQKLAESEASPPSAPPVETTLFGENVLNIGDLWGLTDVVAAHYEIPRAARNDAFLATRAFMDSPAFQMRAVPGLIAVLQRLQQAGIQLLAMTNSPAETTAVVLGKLGVTPYFSEIRTAARKPHGIRELLAAHATSTAVLSIGDNYINEIAPALRVGAAALYIDRFATGFGRDEPRCTHRSSIAELVAWLNEQLDS